MFIFPPQLILGHGVRRLHVSAALGAKAKVSMSRFEPSSCVNYDKLQSSVNIVRKRSACSTHACFSLSCLFVFPLLSPLVCYYCSSYRFLSSTLFSYLFTLIWHWKKLYIAVGFLCAIGWTGHLRFQRRLSMAIWMTPQVRRSFEDARTCACIRTEWQCKMRQHRWLCCSLSAAGCPKWPYHPPSTVIT